MAKIRQFTKTVLKRHFTTDIDVKQSIKELMLGRGLNVIKIGDKIEHTSNNGLKWYDFNFTATAEDN